MDEKAERRRQRNRAWRQANPDKVKAARRAYKAAHPDKVKASRRRWFHRWEKRNPEKAAERSAARKQRFIARVGIDEYRRRQAATERRRQRRLKRERGARIYAAAAAVVPARLPRDVRDDVIAALVLGVIEKRFTIADMPAQAKAHLTAHYRDFGQFRTVSLDDVMPGIDRFRRVETIAADAFHF